MEEKLRYSGRFKQTLIYLGKLFRMFVFQNDWKVFPMAAVITEIVVFVISKNMFVNMEGTVKGAFALSCICIWNGMFNSIQVICRERAIIKREHRSGMHISSYVLAHMIYQAVLCLGQSAVMLLVMHYSKMKFPETGIVTGSTLTDLLLTFFFITYSADMLAMFVSSLVKNPTTAMTVVPFLLIFQLVFAGTFFSLKGVAKDASDFTLSKYGINAICSQSRYNDLPMTSVWKSLDKMGGIKLEDLSTQLADLNENETSPQNIANAQEMIQEFKNQTPYGNKFETVKDILEEMKKQGKKDAFEKYCGKQNIKQDYESTTENIAFCWGNLIFCALLFAGLSMISLNFIDKDKR